MKNSQGRAIGAVMIITVLCRVMSLVANQFYISHFGAADVELNIYSYAASMPNIIFNSLGTAISTVVIPIFASLTAEGKDRRANLFVSNVITVFGSIISLLVIGGMLISPYLPMLTEFKSGEQYDFAVKALMIVMPVMLFYGLSYIFQGVLQSLGHFAFPAAVSLPSSLVIIGYVVLLADKYGVTGLLWATVLGLFLQAAILIPTAVKAGFRFKWTYDLKNPDLRQAFSLILPVLLGSGAFQINMFYNVTLTANFPGTVTLLTFVQNLVLSTVLAVVYSATAVLYPKMTKELAVGNEEGYKNTLEGGINSFLFLFIPATFGIIAVRNEFLNLISGYGKVTQEDIGVAGKILALYSIAFVSIALKELLDRGFFAAKSTRIPAVCGFITVGANVVFSQIGIKFLGVYAVPLAYSLSSFCAVGFLLVKMGKRLKGIWKSVIRVGAVSLVSSAVMFALLQVLTVYMPHFDGILGKIIGLAVPVLAGGALYALMSVLLRNPVAMKMLKRG